MFNRPRCKQCEKKISKKYTYCPHCGFCQKNKVSELFQPALDNLGFPFSFLFKKLTKDLEKQLSNLDLPQEPPTLDSDQENFNVTNGFPGGTMGISINIDNKNGQPVIRIGSMDKNKRALPAKRKMLIKNPEISPEKAEKISNLPKAEPETRVTRLTNRLIYEIKLPGVTKENIIIRKLENSIEIKAFSEEKVYTKLIPLSLPVINSNLKEGKLTLELKL